MASTVRKALDCVWVRALWLMLLLSLGCLCTFSQDKPQTPQQTNQRITQLASVASIRSADGEIPIGSGDLLHIDVFDVPELSRDVRVGETGLISLPLVPERIPVAGCTPYQVEGMLEKILETNGLVMRPDVSVMVKDQNSDPISVAGAVRHPVVYHEFRPTTLIEVLSAAEGIADDAGDKILITRSRSPATVCGQPDPPSDPANTERMKIGISDLLDKGDPTFNVPVYGGDVITVPRAGIIYVAGAVAQPGGYTLNDPGSTFNTMKIIALAHGLIGSAKANKTVILRKDPNTGQTKEIKIRLKRIMDRKDPDVRLYAGDILYVPDSGTRRILGRAGEAAIGIGTGLAIYRVP